MHIWRAWSLLGSLGKSYLFLSCRKLSRILCFVRKKINWTKESLSVGGGTLPPTPQKRTNTKNWKQIFPEKELRGHVPISTLMCLWASDLYIPTIDLPILLLEICGPILGIYKSLRGTWMWKLGLRPRNLRKGIHKWDFRCSALEILLFSWPMLWTISTELRQKRFSSSSVHQRLKAFILLVVLRSFLCFTSLPNY